MPAPSTVADVLIDALARAGTVRLFAAGGVLAGGLAEAARRRDVALVPVGAASGACVMAAVTARITERPAAAVLSGTSAAEAAPALAHAALDRAPVVVVADAGATAIPAVKGMVGLEPASAGHWIAHALHRALGAPPGPMHVAVAAATLAARVTPVATVVRPVVPPAAPVALEEAVRVLTGATRPVILAGLGCRSPEAAAWLRPFAETLPAPAIVTARARGALPDPHPLSLGQLGSTGADALLARADLVVALGVDPVELPDGAWPGRTVLDVAPAAPEERRPPAVARVDGEVARVLEELAPRLREHARADWDVAELDRLKRGAARPAAEGAALVALAREALPAGTVATADEPLAAAVEAGWQAVAPHELLAPLAPGLGGFAVAAAVAARLARPTIGAIAFAAAGAPTDVGLEVAARLRLPVITVVLGRGGLPPGVPIAEARTPEAMRAALAIALAARGPVVLDARR